MAITASERAELIGLYVGMFNAAPGANNLSALVEDFEAGSSLEDIAKGLAAGSTFKGIYPSLLTGNEFAVKVALNILGTEVDEGQMDFAVDWVESRLNSGLTRGEVVLKAVKALAAITSASPKWVAAKDALTNKVAVATYYSVTKLQSSDDLATLQAVISGVNSTAESVTTAKDTIDGTAQNNPGIEFTLTTGQDVLLGTSGDDTFNAIDEDDTTDTLTLGDVIDGGEGDDTFDLVGDNTDLTLSGIDLTSVENLIVRNTNSAFETLDIDNNPFATVTVDNTGTTTNNLTVSNINSVSALTVTDVEAAGSTNTFDFKTNTTSATGNVSVTLDGVDAENDSESFVFNSAFTAATAMNLNYTVANVDDADAGESVNVRFNVDTGTKTDVVFNTTLNVTDFSTASSSDIELYIDQAGDSSNTTTVNLTNVDGAATWLYLDNDSNATGGADVATFNLDGVSNANGDTELYVTDSETLNVNVISDSALEDFGMYYNGDGSDPGELTINLTADADLSVEFWDLNDASGATEDTLFNITGAGDVTIADLDDGSSNVTIDASTATGSIDIGSLEAGVVSVTTGSGNDSIEVGSDETTVSLGAGDDTLDTAGYDFGTDSDSAELDGGAGTDTISINDGANLDAATALNIMNFEILDFTDGTGTYDLSIEDSLNDLSASTSIGGAVTITEFGSDNTLTLTGFVDTDVIEVVLADDGLADEITVNIGALDVTKNNTADGGSDAVLVISEVEKVTVTSSAVNAVADKSAVTLATYGASSYTNVVDLDAAVMTSLVLDGASKTSVTFTDATALLQINATANEAGVTVDASAGGMASGLTFSGSAKADTYTATDNGDLIQGAGGADTITLGAGDDTIRYESQAASTLKLTDTTVPADGVSDLASGYDVITGFTSGSDIIELSSLLGLATGDAQSAILQKGAIAPATAAVLQTLIGTGVDFFDTGVVDRATAFVNDGTDGYLFIDANKDGNFTQADDMMVELVGVTALTVVDLQFG